MAKVKICGITNLEDALDAINAGADALGFVFYEKSKRYILPEDALKIIEELPPFIERVGLFVNKSAKEINRISKESKISLAQIHFEADENLFRELNVKYIRVIRAKEEREIQNFQSEYRLIDAFVPSYGGEGKRLNLNWFENKDCSNIILAGGLSCENLTELKKYNFYGVDVSSSVEIEKGKKDKNKMMNFIKIAKEL